MKLLRKLLKDESGATAIEYGLIAAGISVAIIAVVNGLGAKLKATFTSVLAAEPPPGKGGPRLQAPLALGLQR